MSREPNQSAHATANVATRLARATRPADHAIAPAARPDAPTAVERHAGKVFRVVSEPVTLPSGRRSVRDVIRHKGAVAILPIATDPLEIVLVHQHRHPTGGRIWEIPAGTLDHPGESPAACAQREAVEETGYEAGVMRLVSQFYTAPGFCDERIWLFAAWDLRATARGALDDDEQIDVHRRSWADVVTMQRTGQIEDAKTLVALGWLQAALAEA